MAEDNGMGGHLAANSAGWGCEERESREAAAGESPLIRQGSGAPPQTWPRPPLPPWGMKPARSQRLTPSPHSPTLAPVRHPSIDHARERLVEDQKPLVWSPQHAPAKA
jgi:hypothetical protein